MDGEFKIILEAKEKKMLKDLEDRKMQLEENMKKRLQGAFIRLEMMGNELQKKQGKAKEDSIKCRILETEIKKENEAKEKRLETKEHRAQIFKMLGVKFSCIFLSIKLLEINI